MKRLSFLFTASVLVLAGFSAYTVQLSYFDVDARESDFMVTWQTEVEEQVRAYELYRKTSYNEAYTLIQSFDAHGAEKPYEYMDDQVYKSASEEVDYRLDAVFSNGLRQQLGHRSMNYTPTYVRRTWGSIKAMFQ